MAPSLLGLDHLYRSISQTCLMVLCPFLALFGKNYFPLPKLMLKGGGTIAARYRWLVRTVDLLVWIVEFSVILTARVPKIDGFFRRNSLLISKLSPLE